MSEAIQRERASLRKRRGRLRAIVTRKRRIARLAEVEAYEAEREIEVIGRRLEVLNAQG